MKKREERENKRQEKAQPGFRAIPFNLFSAGAAGSAVGAGSTVVVQPHGRSGSAGRTGRCPLQRPPLPHRHRHRRCARAQAARASPTFPPPPPPPSPLWRQHPACVTRCARQKEPRGRGAGAGRDTPLSARPPSAPLPSRAGPASSPHVSVCFPRRHGDGRRGRREVRL